MEVLDELDAAVAANTARQQRLAQARTEMSLRRFTNEIPDVVRVTVNGVGELLEIELASGCLDNGRQLHLLGEQVTDAVTAARRQATEASRDVLAEVVGEQVVAGLLDADRPEQVRRRQSSDAETEEYFEDKDAEGYLEDSSWLP